MDNRRAPEGGKKRSTAPGTGNEIIPVPKRSQMSDKGENRGDKEANGIMQAAMVAGAVENDGASKTDEKGTVYAQLIKSTIVNIEDDDDLRHDLFGMKKKTLPRGRKKSKTMRRFFGTTSEISESF